MMMMMMSHPLLFIFMVTLFPAAYGVACPDDANLASWSTLNVNANEDVTISTGILFDQSLTEEFAGITVGSGGKLVFKRDLEGTLKVNHIVIKDGGRVDIGAEEDGCRHTGKFSIQLLGGRIASDTSPHKAIIVEDGGHLNIYGMKQRSWTRLTTSLVKIPEESYLYMNKVTQDDKVQGFITFKFNLDQNITKDNVDMKIYNFKTKSQEKFNKKVEELETYLNAVPANHVVIGAVRKSLMARDDTKDFEKLYIVIENFLGLAHGAAKMRTLQFYDGYVMLMKKGDSNTGIEQTSKYRANSVDQFSVATLFDGDLKFRAESYTRSKNFGKSYIIAEVNLRVLSEPIIELSDDISTWHEGNTLLIASTSKNPDEHQYATITEVIDSTHVRVDLPGIHDHVCTTYKGVYMCAEVALIDRNFLVEGVTDGSDQYGGHIKCKAGFGSCNFADFELNLMGSHFPLGRYPLHFHLAGDVGAPNGEAIIDGVSIHNSYARCATIHGTNNVTVQNTVCIECIGHGFFLEDGDERWNKFTHNFATLQRKAGLPNKKHLIPSDKLPSGFFITNPDNLFTKNAVAGPEGHGYYFIFPKSPIGESSSLTVLAEGEASRTNVRLFADNSAHGCLGDGVRFDDHLTSEGEIKMNNGYNPRIDPSNPTSQLAELHLSCITAWSNGKTNIHVRAAEVLLENCSVAKGKKGISVWRGIMNQRYRQEVKHSIILGDRENADAEDYSSDTDPRVGLELTGPLTVNRVYFDDFYKSDYFPSGAIGFAGRNMERITGNKIDDAFFGFKDPADGNRVLRAFPDDDREGNLVESFIDGGSVTDSDSPVTVLRSTDFQFTNNCYKRSNWENYAVCDESYTMVEINKPAHVTRVDSKGDVVNLDTAGDVSPSNTPFNVLNNQHFHYLVHVDDFDFAQTVKVKTRDANKGKKFVIGFCVPVDAELRVQYNNDDQFRSVASYDDLVISSEQGYYHNVADGIVFVNVVGQESSNNDVYCLDDYDQTGICRSFFIKVTNGITEKNDCTVAAEQYTPPSPTQATRVFQEQTLTNAEKRLLQLIEALVDSESKNPKRTVKNLKRRLRRSLADPDRDLPVTSVIPAGFGASCN